MAGDWFDSHCHLQDRYAAGQGPEETCRRAAEAGVGRLVCVGTDAGTSREALGVALAGAEGRLGASVPGIWATAGLHPHDAWQGTAEVVALVEGHLAHQPARRTLVAVGETGLDYHYDHSPRDVQRRAFAEQIALAHRFDLALVVHARQAWDDLFDVLAAEGVPERTVLHCFTGGPAELRRCLDAGMFVSFSGIVTFQNAAEVREAAARCPLDRLLVETDSPFLAPVPHRGRANEPAYLPLVGSVIAELRGMEAGELARRSAAAAAALYAL
ncbi:MAG TPA: TatD family hydrolase [Acidimicrobiales bacterium]|nr:TatD family hydrolase [Acidimicrobiales bacterium]